MAGRKVKGCYCTHRQAQSAIPTDSKLRSRIQSPGQSEFKDWPGFLFVSPLQLQNILATDNPLAARIIFAFILLGARRDAGDLSQDGDLLWGASAVRNACLSADSWPAGRHTSLTSQSKGSSVPR